MAGGVWQGACMVGGMPGRDVCGGGMHGRGHAGQILRDTVIRSMNGRYSSYWNAFLLLERCSDEPRCIERYCSGECYTTIHFTLFHVPSKLSYVNVSTLHLRRPRSKS